MTDRIPVERLARLIDEIPELPSIRYVSFAGGECFLLGRELDELMARAAGYGYIVDCTTNGYWAVSRKAALGRLARSQAAGLRAISFSTGEMHSKYVPVERIVHGAIAAHDLGLIVTVSIEDFDNSTFDRASIRNNPEIASRIGQRNFTVFDRTWIPHADGKGTAKLTYDPQKSRYGSGRASGCTTILEDLTISPTLQLAACCGYPLESIPELHLGSVAEKSIGQVFAEAPLDILKVLLHVAGPEMMLEFVKRFMPDYELPTSYTHQCQSCLHLHRDPVAMATLHKHAPEVEGAIRAEFVRMRSAAVPFASEVKA